MNARNLPTALAAVTLTALALTAMSDPTPTPTPTPDPSPTYTIEPAKLTDLIVQGTIRWQSPTSWTSITDDGHTNTGIANVELLPDRVRIHYTQTATRVRVCTTTPDEAFTAAAVRTGASAALTHVDILFYMGTNTSPVNPALLTRKGANVWVHCEHETTNRPQEPTP